MACAIFQWIVARGFLWMRRASGTGPSRSRRSVDPAPPLVGAKIPAAGHPRAHLGFLGISYVTFRSLDVIFGIRDGSSSPPRRPVPGLPLLLPDHLVGPHRPLPPVQSRLGAIAAVPAFLEDLDGAVHRVFTGFLYKFILAASIKSYWIAAAPTGGLLNTLSYMYGYSLYLYFDFAGYSAFAVGFSYLLGSTRPRISTAPSWRGNIKDFWNRWHISLSTWLRDHVYMRFMLAATKGALVHRQVHGVVPRALPPLG